jgi:histidyl-tRNA synthetase
MNAPFEAVRGMRDILSQEKKLQGHVQAVLENLLHTWGYAPLDVPILEHRDLYLRKMGEELVGKLYEFTFGGRDLALRPEWTASVLRAYVATMQEHPLPLRLCYSGPVFRYQRPQRLTYRQFTQVGVELIGGTPPRADAEVLALACEGLHQVGVTDYKVQIGHIGIIRETLAQLAITERTQGLLTWNLERMRTRGQEEVREKLHTLMGDPPIDPALLEGLDDEQATALLLRLFQTMGINLSFGTRPPESIVRRLVRKLRRDDPQTRVEQALDLLWQLGQIGGTPNEAIQQAAELLENTGVQVPALAELRAVLALLEAHGIPGERIQVDFGMGRGLHYYTGMIFEIRDTSAMQICGGGRYDDLIQVLGGSQSVPAVGFSYGLERLVSASTLAAEDEKKQRDVLVAPLADTDYPYALDVARRLRQHGFVVTIDVRGRNAAKNQRDAARRGIAYVAMVGADDYARNEIVWRSVEARQEKRVNLDELGAVI